MAGCSVPLKISVISCILVFQRWSLLATDIFSIRFIDIYPKIDESYRVQTSGGAICKSAIFDRLCSQLNSTHCLILCNISVSILGWILIAILALAEVRNYMTPKFKEHMIVDTSLKQQLRINVNITFHSLTCNEVSS